MGRGFRGANQIAASAKDLPGFLPPLVLGIAGFHFASSDRRHVRGDAFARTDAAVLRIGSVGCIGERAGRARALSRVAVEFGDSCPHPVSGAVFLRVDLPHGYAAALGGKLAIGVEAGQAEPVDRAFGPDQRGGMQVSDETVGLQFHDGEEGLQTGKSPCGTAVSYKSYTSDAGIGLFTPYRATAIADKCTFVILNSMAKETSTYTAGANGRLSQQQIQQRAYELWHQDGRPDGADQHYWYRAERELSSTAPSVSAPLKKSPADPVPDAAKSFSAGNDLKTSRRASGFKSAKSP